MKLSTRSTFLVFLSLLLVPLAAAASDSGTCIVSMSASLDSAVLISGATEVTVVSSATPILFVGDDGELKAEIGVLIPDGSPTSFDSVRITLSNISFSTFLDCANGSLAANPSTLTDLVVPFEEEDEEDDVEEVTPGQMVTLELRFDAEAGLEPDGAGCFTGDFVADPAPAFEAELEDEAAEEEDLEFAGQVVSVGASDFVLDVDGTEVTITTDANTRFDDLTGLGDLAAGDLVKAEVDVQPDGSFLATEVERLFDEDDENGATGRIACVDPESGEATSVTLVFASSNPDHDFPAVTVQVNLQGGTKFKVNKAKKFDTTGLSFDASNLSPGQRITAAGTPFTGGVSPELDAGKLILKPQEVRGMVVDGSVDTNTGIFQINITSASSVLLTGPVTVRTDGKTRFAGRLRGVANLTTTDTYRIKGLLMRNGPDAGDVIFLAKKVKKVKGGG